MTELNLERFDETVNNIRKKAKKEGRLEDNPSDERLRLFVENEPGMKKTIHGNYVAESEPNSRAAAFTQNSIDFPFAEKESELLDQCQKSLDHEKLISIDRIVGNNDSEIVVRLTVPQRFAHVAYGGGRLFIPTKGAVEKPTYEIIMFADDAFEANKSKPLPEKDITIRLAMLDDGRIIKIVRNSNYIGEYKKGVFASEDWSVKIRSEGIFLHAGCRDDYLEMAHGSYESVRSLLVALSANGKTSTTCKILARKEQEKSWLVQDDGGTLMPDGSFHGFEGGGIFVKTESLNPGDQIETYYGLMKEGTFCENIHVNKEGDFDFYNFEKTSNGRAVIQRKDLMHASSYIDVERVENLILITRGPLIPAISKLTVEQAVACMVLGQSMESSAGDPTQAGKIKNVFFYDPFITGDRIKHAHRLYSILKGLPHMKYYLINTGGIGEGRHYQDIKLEHTMNILDSLIRGSLEDWIDSPTGFQVPGAIGSVDSIYLHPEKLYSPLEFEEKLRELNKIRNETLEKVGTGLDVVIQKTFQ